MFTSPVVFTLPVASMCLWYPGREKSSAPCPAVVTTSTPNGILSLTLFVPYATDLRFKKGVRHIGDPYLNEKPQVAAENGTWDYAAPSEEMKQIQFILRSLTNPSIPSPIEQLDEIAEVKRGPGRPRGSLSQKTPELV